MMMPPFRWRMKPFDEREINGVIEIALYEKEMELKLKKANEQLNHANRSNETSSAPHGAAREASPEHGLEQSSINDQRSTIQKVLVMDDEEIIRDLAQLMLPRLGYEVEVACEGVEAIDLYKEARASGKPYDLAILDLTNKGGMGGMETIKRLFQIDPHVKAIISSGYSNDPVMGSFKQYGFCGALRKPFTMKRLEEVLDKVMD